VSRSCRSSCQKHRAWKCLWTFCHVSLTCVLARHTGRIHSRWLALADWLAWETFIDSTWRFNFFHLSFCADFIFFYFYFLLACCRNKNLSHAEKHLKVLREFYGCRAGWVRTESERTLDMKTASGELKLAVGETSSSERVDWNLSRPQDQPTGWMTDSQ
jgi:hypothetical protein